MTGRTNMPLEMHFFRAKLVHLQTIFQLQILQNTSHHKQLILVENSLETYLLTMPQPHSLRPTILQLQHKRMTMKLPLAAHSVPPENQQQIVVHDWNIRKNILLKSRVALNE